jgi:hypothetical protein
VIAWDTSEAADIGVKSMILKTRLLSLMPLILILAFALTPKASQKKPTSTVTDSNFIPHVIFMVLSIIGFLILGVNLMLA